MSDRLNAALNLAERGLGILPLKPLSKEPASPNGVCDATRNPALIRAWFAADASINFGVCAGDDFVILDIDVKAGKEGDARLTELELEPANDSISDSTFTITTPSNGAHYYLKAPFACSNSHSFPPGIDVRGARGYVVGPYCELPNGSYSVARMCRSRQHRPG
jgi:hypothetical protein